MPFRKMCLFAILILLITGCSSQKLQKSDVPNWDSHLPLGETEKPSLFNRLSNVFSDADSDYHFRKVKWGYSKAMVELSEQKQGTRLFHRKGNTLIYNERISGMPVKLVYCFEKDRLRVAGYLTDRPVKNAMEIFDHVAKTLGEPIDMISGGMVWADYHTLIYINGYVSHMTQSPLRYQRSQGLLKILEKNPKEKAGEVLRWDGVWTYVDQNFFRRLHEVDYPLDELSTYEKRLFAILKRRQMRTYITPHGRITLPNNP